MLSSQKLKIMKRIILCLVSFTLLFAHLTFTQNDHLRDADNDTRIDVEKTPDDDRIWFKVEGTEVMALNGKALAFRSPGNSLFFGVDAGQYDDGSDNENTFIGYRSGRHNTTGAQNTFLGFESGNSHKSGLGNILTGHQSGKSLEFRDGNTFVGFKAGKNLPYGWGLTFVGDEAGLNSSSNSYYCTFLGYRAGMNNNNLDNTFLGYTAGEDNNNGEFNTFTGAGSGRGNINGSQNAFYGAYSGDVNSTGNFNTFLGTFSGWKNKGGKDNTFVGAQTGLTNEGGDRNVYIGSFAGASSESGNENVFIGYQSGYKAENTVGNVFIGHESGKNQTENNLLFIENSDYSVPLIWGNFRSHRVGINRIANTNAFEVNGNASKATPGDWLGNSDARLKKNIKSLDSEETLQKILNMQGVTYEWKKDEENMRPKGKQYGFTAQEIQAIYPHLVTEDAKGYLQTAYGTYDPMFVECFKAMYGMIEELRTEVDSLKKELNSTKPTLNNDSEETVILIEKPAAEKPSLRIFPNPATDILNVEISENEVLKQILISDVSGSVLFSKYIRDNHSKIFELKIGNLNLTAGMYLLEFEMVSGEVISEKLMVQ